MSLLMWVALWLCLGTALIVWGAGWVLNWQRWADRMAARYRAFWGPFAFLSGSAAYQRLSGVYLIALGLITYYLAFRWFGQHVHNLG